MTNHTATVETLTAEVRVLMVGSRQVTMSVYQQLDVVAPWWIEAFGRVNPKGKLPYEAIRVVGRDGDGNLVRSYVPSDPMGIGNDGWIQLDSMSYSTYRLWNDRPGNDADSNRSFLVRRAAGWSDLPLIVLAGLR